MYLAQYRRHGRKVYVIRTSYPDSRGTYAYRQIFNLGPNPKHYIHQPAENVHYYAEALEKAVENEYGGDPAMLLDELLWDFLSLERRRNLSNFRRKAGRKPSPLSSADYREIQHHVHLFDRRRLYYIRYGAVDQSRLFRVNEKLYRPLLRKCRDEKEFYFRNLERSLEHAEYKKYIFAVFDLQRSFSESFSPFMPEALDQEKMDHAFLAELCRLNVDVDFWQDDSEPSFLRSHLRNYLIRFFDYDFETRSFRYDYYQEFRSRHRRFRWPETQASVSTEQMSALFGRSIDELRNMDTTELARAFRAKAKEYHPDGGGQAEQFIQLRQAYEKLKKK
jgi:hypothetical protein